MNYKSLLIFAFLILNSGMIFSEDGYAFLKGNPYASLKSGIKDEKAARLYFDLMNDIYLRDQKARCGTTDTRLMYEADSINFEKWTSFVEKYGFFSPNDPVFIRLLGKEKYEKLIGRYIPVNMHWCDYYGLALLQQIERSIPRKTCTKRDLMEQFWRYLLRRTQYNLSFYNAGIEIMVLPYFEAGNQDVYDYTFGKFVQVMNENNACLSITIPCIEMRNGRMNWEKATLQSPYLDKRVLEKLLEMVKITAEKLILFTYHKKHIPPTFRVFISTSIHYPMRLTFYKVYQE